MKLTKLLSSVIIESADKGLINEVSEKIKNQLLAKFKPQTSDDDEAIINNIDYFEKIKNGLPSDKRDIMKYSYDELNSLISSKKTGKTIEDLFKLFKKKEKGIENKELKNNIRKFLEIKDELPRNKQKIEKYSFLDLVKLNREYWGKVISKKAFDKIKKERQDLTDEIILYYVTTYIENFNELPENTPSILNMSFNDLEHKLDAIQTKEQGLSGKKDYSDVEVIYDNDNLLIFQPKTKDQCIKLKNGRSWCTSREGGGNLYYNYRLENNLTLYYVIDEDKPFNDLNYSVVILVSSDGRKRLADKSNSGRYAGSTVISWDEISEKVPKLADKEDLFVPKPLSSEEQDLLRKYKKISVGDNPIEELGGENEVELWLEMNSPKLNDIQYKNLTKELKKKYIALGMDLTTFQIQNSEPDVLKYYISKKIDTIRNKGLSNLTVEDIALLNNPILKNVKADLKSKFISDITLKGDKIEITYPSSSEAKFIVLYGFDEFFESLPDTIKTLSIINKSDDIVALDVPSSLGNLTNLETLFLENIVKSLPESIGNLTNLQMLSIYKNPKITKLPNSILNLKELILLNLEGSDNIVLSDEFKQVFSEFDKGYWVYNV